MVFQCPSIVMFGEPNKSGVYGIELWVPFQFAWFPPSRACFGAQNRGFLIISRGVYIEPERGWLPRLSIEPIKPDLKSSKILFARAVVMLWASTLAHQQLNSAHIAARAEVSGSFSSMLAHFCNSTGSLQYPLSYSSDAPARIRQSRQIINIIVFILPH